MTENELHFLEVQTLEPKGGELCQELNLEYHYLLRTRQGVHYFFPYYSTAASSINEVITELEKLPTILEIQTFHSEKEFETRQTKLLRSIPDPEKAGKIVFPVKGMAKLNTKRLQER